MNKTNFNRCNQCGIFIKGDDSHDCNKYLIFKFQKGHEVPAKWKENLHRTFKGKTYEEIMGKEKAIIKRQKLSNAQKGHIPWNKNKKNIMSETTKKQISDKLIKYFKTHKQWHKGLTKETSIGLQRMSNNKKDLWQNKEYKEHQLKKLMKLLFKRPTKLEQRFISFFDKYHLPFKYVGNGKLYINGKFPDFVESNGRKIVIDVANKDQKFRQTHISPIDYEIQRINHFNNAGWKWFVIWEDELKNENQLIKKIKQFINYSKEIVKCP